MTAVSIVLEKKGVVDGLVEVYIRNSKGEYTVFVDESGKVYRYKDSKKIACKSSMQTAGYLVSGVGSGCGVMTHRLVATAFCPGKDEECDVTLGRYPRDGKPLGYFPGKTYKQKRDNVNHIDGNKENNHPSNLEWVSVSENMKHSKENNLFAMGERSPLSKLTDSQREEIRNLHKQRIKQKDIAKQYGVTQPTISYLLREARGLGEEKKYTIVKEALQGKPCSSNSASMKNWHWLIVKAMQELENS